jgi:hypothetical protein
MQLITRDGYGIENEDFTGLAIVGMMSEEELVFPRSSKIQDILGLKETNQAIVLYHDESENQLYHND